MKGLKRTITILTAIASLCNIIPFTAFANNNADEKNYEEECIEYNVGCGDDSTLEHAYDPIEELVAEEEYRDSVEIEDKKLIFSVLDYRINGEKVVYLNDSSELCNKNGLKNVTFVIETKTDKVEAKEGFEAYEVFYEAQISDPEVWNKVDALNASGEFMTVEPDFIWEDTAVGDYKEASVAEIANESHFETLGISDVWSNLKNDDIVPGDGVVVAVIDTGVDYNHDDLKDSMWVNTGEIAGDGIDNDGNGYVDDVYGIDLIAGNGNPMDDHGHGTHVAGIVAMNANGKGGVGVAYGAKIMAIKAGQSNGNFAASDITRAINYAANNGADVINMSFGGTGKSTLVEAALADANSRCVLVASAGNDGLPTNDASSAGYIFTEDIYPAGYNYVLGVMASDVSGNKLASYSNWDFANNANCEYELVAPGTEIYSTLPGNRYAKWSGTSMAAPAVSAAAAIIRSKYTDKSKYTSKFIMGQLASATTDTVRYVGAKGDSHVYSALNIKSSLKNLPKPNITVNEIYMFDGTDISETNNNDGIAQPNEILDMGIVLRNQWGSAKNVKVKVDAVSAGGIENPYVEFINDEIELTEIGTFATVNNGYIYTDDMLTGVSNPIRFKIKEGTPNDAQITFNITVTASNDMDEKDKETYSTSTAYTLIVQNGYALSGRITEDMTLTKDKYWIIENNLLIPKGVTVTVEPGTQIQFWSSDENNPYGEEANVYILVDGKFLAEGTEEEPIEMFVGKGYETEGILIKGRDEGSGILDDDYMESYVKLEYTNVINPICYFTRQPWSVDRFVATEINHCTFIQNYKIGYKFLNDNPSEDVIYFGHVFSKEIFYSIFNNFKNDFNVIAPDPIHAEIVNTCLINHSSMIYTADETLNSVFLQNTPVTNYRLGNIDIVNQKYTNNAILNDIINYDSNNIMSIKASGDNNVDISQNYWGTDNNKLVKLQVKDADSDVALSDLVQEPYLTLSDDMSLIYPFVTEAYITDLDGNRLDTVSGSQTVQMHVMFNRDMASDVQPLVTYGGEAPYTDYYVDGDWATAREWVSTMTIDPFIDMGTMYIRVKGAAAADDKWLVTGDDEGRFSFKIEKNTAQAMALQGSGASGSNELSWYQDDFDTLAGYNIYRSESYDNTINVSEQNFKKLNSTIISGADTEFIDNNVAQGKDYYYYFTVIDTQLKESNPSNVVKCTPLDGEKPVIRHKEIVSGVKGEAISVTAEVTDNVKVGKVTLYYKKSNSDSWQNTEMKLVNGITYKAVISSYEVKEGTIQYYIEANDGINTASIGSYENPVNIIIRTPQEIKGDINADGNISVADVVLMQQYLVKSISTIAVTPDINDDGKVDVFDLIILKRMVMEIK